MDDFNALLKSKIENYSDDVQKLINEALNQSPDLNIDVIAEKIIKLSKLVIKEENK